jgi:hypothetical protein
MHLVIDGCELRDTSGSIMVIYIHIDKYDKLMEGIFNVYFIESLYEPAHLPVPYSLLF